MICTTLAFVKMQDVHLTYAKVLEVLLNGRGGCVDASNHAWRLRTTISRAFTALCVQCRSLQWKQRMAIALLKTTLDDDHPMQAL